MSISLLLQNANAFALSGDYINAVNLYFKILEEDPNNSEAKNSINSIQVKLNQHQNGCGEEQKFEVIPDQLMEQIWTLYNLDQFSELLELLEHLIPLCEPQFDFFLLAGSCCRHLHIYDRGMAYLKFAIALNPRSFKANLEASKIFIENKMINLAAKTLDICIEIDPSDPEVYWLRAELERDNGNYSKAIDYFEKSRDLGYDYSFFESHIGLCLFELGDYAAALKAHKNDLRLNPDASENELFQIHSNIIVTAMEVGDLHSATASIEYLNASLRDGTDIEAVNQSVIFALSIANLTIGNIELGWKYYFYRFQNPEFPTEKRKFVKPRPTKLHDFDGKTVLLWREQGVGDEIMFLSLLDHLRKSVKSRFILEIDKRLISIVKRSFPDVEVRAPSFNKWSLESREHDFDLQLPIGDMQILLNHNQNGSSYIRPWLKVNNKLENSWKNFLGSDKPVVGFSYKSGVVNTRRKKHYLDLEFYHQFLLQRNFTWVWLDYSSDRTTFESLPKEIKENVVFPEVDLKNDFENLAAILACCALYVGPGTTTLAVAGSIGVPCLSFSPFLSPYSLGSRVNGENVVNHPYFSDIKQFIAKTDISNHGKNIKFEDLFQKKLNDILLIKN